MNKDFEIILLENAESTLPTMGTRTEKRLSDNIIVTKLVNNGAESRSLLLEKSLSFNDTLMEEATDTLARCIKAMLRKYNINKNKLCLVVGLGNEGMTADALGAKVLKYLDITEHLFAADVAPRSKGRIAAIASNVSGVTGLPSFDIISGVAGIVKPDIIIAVDTLASKTTQRLVKVIQLSDGGIVPGSGVNNAKKELTYKSLGVPIVAIGVPMVIYAKNIIADYLDASEGRGNIKNPKTIPHEMAMLNELVVTVKDIDMVVEDYAKVIARAVNKAVHGKCSMLS